MNRLPHCLASLLGRKRQRFACLTSTRVAGWCDQLTQHLRNGFRPHFAQLANGRSKRSTERWRHRDAGETPFQGLHPTPVGPFRWGRVQQEILRHPERQPQSKQASPLGPPAGLRQQIE
jgi:hypothetical protein